MIHLTVVRWFYFVLNMTLKGLLLKLAVYPVILSGSDRYINAMGGINNGMDQSNFRKAQKRGRYL